MANMESDFEDEINSTVSTRTLDDFVNTFDESEYIESNILTLDDNRETASHMSENVEDGSIPNISHTPDIAVPVEKEVNRKLHVLLLIIAFKLTYYINEHFYFKTCK